MSHLGFERLFGVDPVATTDFNLKKVNEGDPTSMLRQFGFVFLFFASTTFSGPRSLVELSASQHRPGSCLIVNKAKRKLEVWTLDKGLPKLALTTDVDIGKGAGEKLRRGDLKTPEGVYFLIDRKAPPEIPASIYGNLAFTKRD